MSPHYLMKRKGSFYAVYNSDNNTNFLLHRHITK